VIDHLSYFILGRSHRRLRNCSYGLKLAIVGRITHMNYKSGVTHVRSIAWLIVSASMLAFGIDGGVDDSFFFASATLPAVQAHPEKIKRIAASAGISTN
jgi:hypothetical protein